MSNITANYCISEASQILAYDLKHHKHVMHLLKHHKHVTRAASLLRSGRRTRRPALSLVVVAAAPRRRRRRQQPAAAAAITSASGSTQCGMVNF